MDFPVKNLYAPVLPPHTDEEIFPTSVPDSTKCARRLPFPEIIRNIAPAKPGGLKS